MRGRTKVILEPGMHRGFRRGMNAVALGDIPKLRRELRKVIGGTGSKMYYYIVGKTIIREGKAQMIERVFGKYGITPDAIWDK